MYLFQVSGWLEYENEEHNGADVLKSQQTAISDTETSCLSLQIKPLNRELHWRSHYPDGSHMIYRGGRAALALICEQVLVKLPSYLKKGGFVAEMEVGFIFLPVDPGQGIQQGWGKERMGPAKATGTCLLNSGSNVWGQLLQLSPSKERVRSLIGQHYLLPA